VEPEDRTASSGLTERIRKEPHQFSFFQLVHLMQTSGSEGVPVGHTGPASRERLRFRPVDSLGFPDGDVAAVERVTDDEGREQFIIETTFLGLYGTTSPLPTHYSEELIQNPERDLLLRGFLDLFHHRLLSLFYRCWEKYRYYVQFRQDTADEYSRRLLCLIGLGLAGLSEAEPIPRVRLLRYLGFLARKSCSAAELRAAISDYFDRIPTRISPWALRWVNVPPEARNQVGIGNCRLDEDLHLGEMVRDRSAKFRITLGPLGLEEYLLFLPDAEDFQALDELVRLLLIDQLLFEVEVILRRGEIPDLRLAEESRGARLGQTTWLGTPARDPRIVFQPLRASQQRATFGGRKVAKHAA
jgi:type VI secretion system protein ImpH